MLNTRQICRLCGLAPATLQNWIEVGVVTPVSSGSRDKNDPRKFSILQSIGLVIGAKIYKSERGCKLSYVGAVVRSFEAIGLEDLERYLDSGYKYFITPLPTKPGLRREIGLWDDFVNVQQCYAEVMASRECE